MEASKRLKLTSDALKQLQEGVSLEFLHWTTLQDAVARGLGGTYTREKAVVFESSVLSFFCQPKDKEPLYIDDLEDLLYEGMESICVIPLDGSVEEVAENLMIMHEECLEGNYQSIQRLREVKPDRHVIEATKGRDYDGDDIPGNDVGPSMMIDSPGPNHEVYSLDMEVDEWITVSRKKNKGRKK